MSVTGRFARLVRAAAVLCVCGVSIGTPVLAQPAVVPTAAPLVVGETFMLDSKVLREARRINVWHPPGWALPKDSLLPVLYMPDGGMQEDFQHVAGLLQVLIGNGSMRPFLLVGIENTQRRRDLTGPTTVDSDRKIAAVVGGSAAFRTFLRDELKPHIAQRYRVTRESAIMGESLAGLFVLETLVLEPRLFDHYLAFDPSLWWNAEGLTAEAARRLALPRGARTQLAIVLSGEPSIAAPAHRLRAALARADTNALAWRMASMPEETHATIYHPAALLSLRTLFAPPRAP